MDSTNTAEKPATLRDHLESLPQELYDEIFSLVIRPTTSETITINSTYKPPKTLQLCRQIRSTFATEYYTKNKFVGDSKIINKWTSSLPAAHSGLDISIKAWAWAPVKYPRDD